MSKAIQKKNSSPNEKYYRYPANFDYLRSYNYQITKQIGRGGYGVVYKACDSILSGEQYAIKINFNTVSRQIVYAQIAFLQLTRGKKNLPKIRNLFIHKESAHIVIDYFQFKPFITFFCSFNMENVKHYLLQLLLGLRSLKQMGIYHRDIKPGNFLYNPATKKGIVIDFGLAQIDNEYFEQLQMKIQQMKLDKDPDYQKYYETYQIYKRLINGLSKVGFNKVGTEGFVPLQTILHYPEQSYSSDIWPVGVIMLQFCLRKYNIFNGVKPPHPVKDIKNPYTATFLIQLAIIFGVETVCEQCQKMGYQLTLPQDITTIDICSVVSIDNFDDNAKDLLFKLLEINQHNRISVQNAIKHPFFDSVRAEH